MSVSSGIDFGRRDYDPARTAKIGAGGSGRRRYSRGRRLIGARMAAGLLSRHSDGAETKNCRCKDPYLAHSRPPGFLLMRQTSYAANTSIGSPAHSMSKEHFGDSASSCPRSTVGRDRKEHRRRPVGRISECVCVTRRWREPDFQPSVPRDTTEVSRAAYIASA